MKKCININPYFISVSKYLGNGIHSETYNEEMFRKDEVYPFIKSGNLYWVADTEKHIKHISSYPEYIEGFNEEEFKTHFKTI